MDYKGIYSIISESTFSLSSGSKMAMKKLTVAMTKEMFSELDQERKERRLASVAEVARVILGQYLREKNIERGLATIERLGDTSS